MNVIWQPQPKQYEFMSRSEDEALYGGSAGGGKSDALVIEATRQVHIPYYKGLILRKTFPQLAELIDKSLNYYTRAFPGAKYNVSNHTWTFPSGAKIIFGAMQHSKDKLNYQGQAYDFIAFDELTHFTYDEYIYMVSRNRPNGPGTRCYMRSTANPGGIGHGWVKDRFITAAPPLTPIYEDVQIVFPDGHTETKTKSRVFVPSTVFDNSILLQNDPQYLIRLASMPEAERNALLYGDWNSYSGQYFGEFRATPDEKMCEAAGLSLEQAKLEHRWTHVIEPFQIPRNWTVYHCYDWGFGKPAAFLWFAMDYDETMYVCTEWYLWNGTPNTGIGWTNKQQAAEAARIEREHPYLKGRNIRGWADPSIWDGSHDTYGISCAEEFEKHGIWMDKGNNERIPGWMQIRERLKFDEDGFAKLYIFNSCQNLIRTFPLMLFDEKKCEDLDTSLEDHNLDALRYGCMGRPIAPRLIANPNIPMCDPLEQFKTNNGQFKKYNALRGR